MAQFKCGSCGHAQAAQNELIGRKVKCPVCQVVSIVVPDIPDGVPDAGNIGVKPTAASNDARDVRNIAARKLAAPERPRGWLYLRRLIPTYPVMVMFIMACTVVLQFLILLRLPTPSPTPIPVSITRISTLDELPVSISEVSTTDELPVSIDIVGAFVELRVSINGVSTGDELSVNLRNHHIIGADPIPVTLQDHYITRGDPIPVGISR